MPKFVVDTVAASTVTLKVPNSNYRNTFTFKGGATGENFEPGQRIKGEIHAPAWKVDRVDMGGNYVEPLVGRPRRMQGTILSVDVAKNELTVQVGYEVTVKLPAKYSAASYQVGERVGWDNIEMPAFQSAAKTPVNA